MFAKVACLGGIWLQLRFVCKNGYMLYCNNMSLLLAKLNSRTQQTKYAPTSSTTVYHYRTLCCTPAFISPLSLRALLLKNRYFGISTVNLFFYDLLKRQIPHQHQHQTLSIISISIGQSYPSIFNNQQEINTPNNLTTIKLRIY